MKRFFLLISFLIVCSLSFAQQKLNFLPKWKVGDSKTFQVRHSEKEYENSQLTNDTSYAVSGQFTVLKETTEAYLLKVVYENVALLSVIRFYDRLGDELKDYQNLKLIYKINKSTGKADLTNWKEAQTFMNDGFEKMFDLIKEKVPEMEPQMRTAFQPILNIFGTKENVEGYMSGEIGFLLFPYGKSFTIGDTLEIVERGANPFNPQDTVEMCTLANISARDKVKKVCDINLTILLDLTEFKAMMTSMLEDMGKSLGADEEARAKMKHEMESINFDMTQKAAIQYNYDTGWPVKAVEESKIIVNDGTDKKEKVVKKMVILK